MSTPPDTPSQRLTVSRMVAWIGYAAIGIIFVLLFLPAIDTGISHTYDSIRMNNMRQVGHAIPLTVQQPRRVGERAALAARRHRI